MKKLFLIAAFLSSWLNFCEEDTSPKGQAVKYLAVRMKAGAETQFFSGAAQAPEPYDLKFGIAGTIHTIYVKENQRVAKGELIANLRTEEFQSELVNSRRKRDSAARIAADAKKALDIAVSDFQNRQISKKRFDYFVELNNNAVNNLNVKSAEVEVARKKMFAAELRAPSDGKIIKVFGKPGDIVSKENYIVVFEAGADTEVKITVPKEIINKVDREAEIQVVFEDIPDRVFDGAVYIFPESNSGPFSSVPIIISLKDSDTIVAPGMRAEVRLVIDFPSYRNQLFVPDFALSEDSLGKFAYVATRKNDETKYGKLLKRHVSTGDTGDKGIEILTGVFDGDLILLDNAANYTEGQIVRVMK